MFTKNMYTEAIPERIFALCKLVEKGSISKLEAKEKMEPHFLNSTNNYFQVYLTTARELGLIAELDGNLSLIADKEKIKNMNMFRRYVISKLETFKDGYFYKVTEEYSKNGLNLCKEYVNIAESASYFSKAINEKVVENDLRAWRFWASFLGFGYLHNMNMIPNADIFLWEIIKLKKIEMKKLYPIRSFIDELRPYCNILINPESKSKELNIAVSNGLRTLHDQRKIEMHNIPDSKDMWTMIQIDTHAISRIVTHIEILE